MKKRSLSFLTPEKSASKQNDKKHLQSLRIFRSQ